MTVLITRPQREAKTLQSILEEKGIASLCEPLLHIQELEFEPGPFLEHDVLIVTSSNALRIFCEKISERHIPVLSVGDQTAQLAHNLGFKTVQSASGRAEDLLALILKNIPNTKRLHYPRGADIAFDLEEALLEKGYNVQAYITYKAQALDAFSAPIQEAFQNQEISHILLYSPRSARVFNQLMANHDLDDSLSYTKILCLSDSMLGCLDQKLLKTVEVSEAPNQESLLELLENSLAETTEVKTKY